MRNGRDRGDGETTIGTDIDNKNNTITRSGWSCFDPLVRRGHNAATQYRSLQYIAILVSNETAGGSGARLDRLTDSGVVLSDYP